MENKEKIEALSEYLGEPVEEKYDDYYVGEDSGEEYLVLTEEEADEQAKEYIKGFLHDQGIEGFSRNFQDEITNYCLDTDRLENLMEDYIKETWDNQDDETIIEQALSDGEISEDDLYDEDGELREEIDVEDLREKCVDKDIESMRGDVVNFIETQYMSFENAGINIEDYIDVDEVADRCIEWDGRGPQLASYDGEEIELGNDLYAYRVD